jgi:hypothetical protein
MYERWINEKKARTAFESGLGASAIQTQMVAQGVGQVQAQTAMQQMMAEVQQGVQTGAIDPNMGIMLLSALLEQGAAQNGGGGGGGGVVAPPLPQFGLPGQGRPPSGQQAPALELKSNGDGTRRGTITES